MVLVRVIYRVSPGWWRVIVGVGAGMLDGGSHQDWPDDHLPDDARRPNAEFWVDGFVNGKPQIAPVPTAH